MQAPTWPDRETQSDHLSITFAALADPTRRAILARLARGEATVTELAAPFDMSLPAISKHLKVLQRAGLVEQGRHAQWRPCRLAPGPLRDVADWIGQYRRHWEASFDRLDEYLRDLQAAEPPPTDGSHRAGASAEPPPATD
jgi:DNA-binding transcriptional ArsR family regulator